MNSDGIKLWRKIMNWTQDRAARELDMSLRKYQYLEAGRDEIEKPVELACGSMARGIFNYQPEENENGKSA